MSDLSLSGHFTPGRLLRFSLPSIGMMIFSSVYGVVDGFFVSNFAGKAPFAAVNFIYPFLMILATSGFLFGTGGTALVAKTMGEGDPDRANRLFSLFTYSALIVGIVVAIPSFVLLRPLCVLLGAEGELLDNSVLYGRIMLIAMPFFVLQLLFQSFFAAAERPRMGLAVTVAAGVTNIVLDAVLVTTLPMQYRLAGAAVASGMSMVVGGAVPLVLFFRPNAGTLRLGKTRMDGKALVQACTNGFSEFLNNIAMSLVGMLYNIQLLRYAGEDGVAAYGVMMYVSMIFSAAFIGYSVGTAPIVSFHFGAGNKSELKSLLRFGMGILSAFAIAMVVSAELCAIPLGRLFVGYDAALMDLTVSGFRIFSLSFLLMGFNIYGSGFFTALNDGLTSALISFLRTMVFQVAAVLLLPIRWGADGIWASVAVAEGLALALTFLFLKIKQPRFEY